MRKLALDGLRVRLILRLVGFLKFVRGTAGIFFSTGFLGSVLGKFDLGSKKGKRVLRLRVSREGLGNKARFPYSQLGEGLKENFGTRRN